MQLILLGHFAYRANSFQQLNGLANSGNERLFLKILVSPDNLLLNLIKVNLILL